MKRFIYLIKYLILSIFCALVIATGDFVGLKADDPPSDTLKTDTTKVEEPVQMSQKIRGQVNRLDSLILEKQKKIKE